MDLYILPNGTQLNVQAKAELASVGHRFAAKAAGGDAIVGTVCDVGALANSPEVRGGRLRSMADAKWRGFRMVEYQSTGLDEPQTMFVAEGEFHEVGVWGPGHGIGLDFFADVLDALRPQDDTRGAVVTGVGVRSDEVDVTSTMLMLSADRSILASATIGRVDSRSLSHPNSRSHLQGGTITPIADIERPAIGVVIENGSTISRLMAAETSAEVLELIDSFSASVAS